MLLTRALTGYWQLTIGDWFSRRHHDAQRKLLPLHELRQHQRVFVGWKSGASAPRLRAFLICHPERGLQSESRDLLLILSHPSPKAKRKGGAPGSSKEPTMLIIGCDYHPGFQQVAMLDRETGEIVQRRLAHPQQAREFYRGLPAGVRVGIESTGFSGWFERLLETLGHQVWIGDATQIRASMTRKQKTDKRDAEHIVKLLVEGRFPRIWVPAAGDRDARQLLVHRH